MDKLIYIIQSQTLDNNYYTIILYGIMPYSIIYENILSRSRTTCLFILFQDRMYGERYLLMTKIVKCKKYLFSSFSPGDLCPLPKKNLTLIIAVYIDAAKIQKKSQISIFLLCFWLQEYIFF